MSSPRRIFFAVFSPNRCGCQESNSVASAPESAFPSSHIRPDPSGGGCGGERPEFGVAAIAKGAAGPARHAQPVQQPGEPPHQQRGLRHKHWWGSDLLCAPCASMSSLFFLRPNTSQQALCKWCGMGKTINHFAFCGSFFCIFGIFFV